MIISHLQVHYFAFNPLSTSVALMICCANQLTGFYMWATLALNGLITFSSYIL